LHAHVNPPTVFVHVAFAPQFAVPFVHSSSSVHVVPSPVYPALHTHARAPAAPEHVALTSQRHSSLPESVVGGEPPS
jgi:hypothetical protein